MVRSLCNSLGFGLFLAMLVTACASTHITSVWKDPKYQKRPAKFMIISVDSNTDTRQFLEEEFAVQLKARGADAIASYTVLSERSHEDPAAIAEKMAELGADAVLITRLNSKGATGRAAPKTIYDPAAYSPKWQDYYGYDKRSLYPLGIIAEEGVVALETRMYEAENIKMVWSASSETAMGGPYQLRIKGYIKTMAEAMAKQGLLGK